MDWSDVGAALAGIAPVLANALLPGVGGPAVALLEKALGVAPGAFSGNPAAAMAALQAATPEQIVALQHAQNELPLAQMAHDLETLKAQLADVQGARGAMVSLAGAHSPIAWGPVVVSCTIFVTSLVFMAVLFWYPGDIEGTRRDVSIAFSGAILPLITVVAQFWLGSSAGSASKQDALTSLTHAVIAQNAKAPAEDLTAALNRQVLAKTTPR